MLRLTLLVLVMMALLGGSAGRANAQQTLTLQEAVRIGLEQNYAIRIARNNEKQADNNYSLGNAGFLPSVNVNASQTKRIEDNKTSYSSSTIPDRETNNAETKSTSATAALNWTVFDGLKMFTSYEKLGELKKLGGSEARARVEATVAGITNSYYNIIQQQNTLTLLQNTLDVSQERIRIAETKLDLGSGSKYDLLQARADYNADKAALMRQQVVLNAARINLNTLLGRPDSVQFAINDTIRIATDLQLPVLRQDAVKDNTDLAIARLSQQVAGLSVKEIRAERFPTLEAQTGYSYSKTESGSSFFNFSRTNGYYYGLTARFNIFDGFDVSRRVQNAKIDLKNSQLALEEARQQLMADLANIYEDYSKSLALVDLEKENLQYAQESLDIALERFKLGTISSIELREAQRTFISAETRLIDAQNRAKNAETELLRLSGRLVSSYE